MSPTMESPKAEDVPLSDALSALGSPTRLALMRAVRTPRTLREIELGSLDGGHERPLARQTVREHLERLIEVGVVSTRPVVREYGDTSEFVVNHQALFGLSEEVRRLARLRPAVEPSVNTVVGGMDRPSAAPRPCLVLVKGLDEGATFDLRPREPNEWIIGRRRGVAISLDFDPSISSHNSLITWHDGHHEVQDDASSRNGTSVNFCLLQKGERVPLRNGDLIGVGRALLLYWA